MYLTHQSDSKSITTKDRRDKATNEGVSLPSRTIVHAKLEMTSPQDAEELEADAVANEIVSGGKIRRKMSQRGSGSSGIAVSSQMESQLSRLQGGGQQMPSGLQSMMEKGFGRDLSQVRLHTDSDAATMSSSIQAKAFTLGNDIYFNQGQYSPETTEGQKLVAHEVTHVVQENEKVAREGAPSTLNYNGGQYGVSWMPNDNVPSNTSVEENGILINNYLPLECGEISTEARNKIYVFISYFKDQISKWESWRNMENWNDGNVSSYIPSINSLLVKFKNLNNDVLLCSNPDYKISLDHIEIRRLLRGSITDHELSLLSEWMQYNRNTFNALQEYFQLNPGPSVEHTYKFNSNIGLNYGVGVGLGGKVETPLGEVALGCYPEVNVGGGYIQFSYQNNLGMKWSQKYIQVNGGFALTCAAEFKIGPSVSSDVISDSLCGGETSSSTWYGPKDFNGFSLISSLGVEGGVGVVAEAGISGLRVDGINSKDPLIFNTSGVCTSVALEMGASASVSGKGGAQIDVSDISKTPSKFVDSIITEKKPDLESVKDIIVKGSVYFDSGSSNLDNGDFSENNNRIIDTIVKNMLFNYNSAVVDKLIVNTIGHASPLWRDAKTDKQASVNNLKLAQERINDTNLHITEHLNRISRKDMSVNVDYVGLCIEDSISNEVDYSTYNKGSEEGLRKTNDKNNNDWQYRRVDIVVYVKRQVDSKIMHI